MINYVFGELNDLNDSKLNNTTLHITVAEGKTQSTNLPYCMVFGESKQPHMNAKLPPVGSQGAGVNRETLKPFARLLQELAVYLKEFEGLSGNDKLTNYYKRRYAQVCWDMHERDYLDVDTLNFYKPNLGMPRKDA